MLKLYHAPRSRSARVLWLLEEMGLAYELEIIPFRDLLAGKHRTPEYLALHPLGLVPLLEAEDGLRLFESGAICAWLTDRHPERGLAPLPAEAARAHWQQWMYFSVATLEPPAWTIIRHTRMLPENKRNAPALASATRRYRDTLEVLEKALADEREWLLGETFTSADIMLVLTLQWSPGFLSDFPKVKAWCARAMARPAYRRAKHAK
ncbi:MAG TPA: glutathione S-transferase family protein [Chromatiaceae bacterium]|nr:glutathione S-transferase family protein [Chromatiaceae bacterium]